MVSDNGKLSYKNFCLQQYSMEDILEYRVEIPNKFIIIAIALFP